MLTSGMVTDGGLETDLIFHHGVDLPEFAAFPLLDGEEGRRLLAEYASSYAAIAAAAGQPFLLETPTWRANPDWAALVGYDLEAVARVNRDAIAFSREIADGWDVPGVVVSGMVGPRGDGYVPGAAVDPDESREYHRTQVAAFAEAGADRITSLTLTDVGEAIGIARAASEVDLPMSIGFTVETDGRLPGGMSLPEVIRAVDAATGGAPEYYVVNCAHPDHILPGLTTEGPWRDRVGGLRVNASRQSHAELDEATELDDGDPADLATCHDRLLAMLPAVQVVGGCCGTDARHVAALWGQAPPQ